MPSAGTGTSLQGISARINGRHAFVHERVLELIARETVLRDGVTIRKSELCGRLKCSEVSLERALRRLRHKGYIVSDPQFDDHGGQLANRYRATQEGLEYLEQSKERQG